MIDQMTSHRPRDAPLHDDRQPDRRAAAARRRRGAARPVHAGRPQADADRAVVGAVGGAVRRRVASSCRSTSPASARASTCRSRCAAPTFELRVWRALQEIPYGETASYGEIARRVGQPQRGARGRARKRAQSDRRDRSLPPRDRRRRLAHRLRRRAGAQAPAARARERPGAPVNSASPRSRVSSASMPRGERMMSSAPDGEPITPAGLVALEAELQELETRGRREIAARILAARELGDLSENAEYHIAKEDQAHLETKIKRLRSAARRPDRRERTRRDRRGVRVRAHRRGAGRGQREGPPGRSSARPRPTSRRASCRRSHRSQGPARSRGGSPWRCARRAAGAPTGCGASSSDTVAVTASHARSSSPLSTRRRRRGRAAVAARARCG